MNDTFDWKKYVIALFVTTFVFLGALWVSNKIYGKQVEEMKTVANQITLNTSASEVQYNLLLETSCDRASEIDPIKDLDRLADMLAQAESQRGDKAAEVVEIKKQYVLLQIKDFLLTKRIASRCNRDPNYILYFYSTDDNCEDCKKQGWVLTDLRREYPELRVYAFDYDMDFPPMKTFRTMYKLDGGLLPALVIGDKTVHGLKTKEELEKIMPFLGEEKEKREKAAAEALKAEKEVSSEGQTSDKN